MALARVRAGRKPLAFAQLTAIDDHAGHEAAVRRLARSGEPAVVIAASGISITTFTRRPEYFESVTGQKSERVPGFTVSSST